MGYTNRNSELSADFYEVGNSGCHIAAIGEKLFIGANTEAGMTAAPDKPAADLISDGNRLAIQTGYVCKAVGDIAEFTLSGGDNNVAVRVYGFDSYEKPVIEEYVNGAWAAYSTASKNGYDGYMAYYDGDGTCSFSFVVDMSGGTRIFRVQQ